MKVIGTLTIAVLLVLTSYFIGFKEGKSDFKTSFETVPYQEGLMYLMLSNKVECKVSSKYNKLICTTVYVSSQK